MASGATAQLVVGVPTYNRAADLEQLLVRLAQEVGSSSDVVVLVSDNASEDDTAAVLERFARSCPWLLVHRQPENVGPFRNLVWLVENAPSAEYLWLFGDDDLPVEGAVAEVLAILRDERPRWLFLPHEFVLADGRVRDTSPAPGAVERHPSSGPLYRAYHHWLSFLSASVVQTEALRDAARRVTAENAFLPFLWYFAAGIGHDCVVAPRHLVRGGLDSTWTDRASSYLTLHVVATYDDGVCADVTREEFARSLDGRYQPGGWALEHWRRMPLERLAESVARFPESEGLRSYLWTLSREQNTRAHLPVLDDAIRAAGLEGEARELVESGEAAFAAADPAVAAERFLAAAQRMPTLSEAWNDLAVALHQLGHPDALSAVETALFVAPDYTEALANRNAILSARGGGVAALTATGQHG